MISKISMMKIYRLIGIRSFRFSSLFFPTFVVTIVIFVFTRQLRREKLSVIDQTSTRSNEHNSLKRTNWPGMKNKNIELGPSVKIDWLNAEFLRMENEKKGLCFTVHEFDKIY